MAAKTQKAKPKAKPKTIGLWITVKAHKKNAYNVPTHQRRRRAR